MDLINFDSHRSLVPILRLAGFLLIIQNLGAVPEADLATFNDGGIEQSQNLGAFNTQNNNWGSLTAGEWSGEHVQVATQTPLDPANPQSGTIDPPQGASFVTFTDFENTGNPPVCFPFDLSSPPPTGERASLVQRFEIPQALQTNAINELVTLLASFKVNLPKGKYAKGAVRLIGLDNNNNEVQDQEVLVSFRPDHKTDTWESIDLREFEGLDLASNVTSVALEIMFESDYPNGNNDVMAIVDDVRVYSHTVSQQCEVDDSDLNNDGVIYVTGTPQNDFFVGVYDEPDDKLKIFCVSLNLQQVVDHLSQQQWDLLLQAMQTALQGAALKTIDTTKLEHVKAYTGRKTDIFIIYDKENERFADTAKLEVYLHSSHDLCIPSTSDLSAKGGGKTAQFDNFSEIGPLMETFRLGVQEVATDQSDVIQRIPKMLANTIGPKSVKVLNDAYETQALFKETWESDHEPLIAQKIPDLEQELLALDQLFEAHEMQMEILLNDEEQSEFYSPLEGLEEEWEIALDNLEDEWEENELSLNDDSVGDLYDQQFAEGTTLTPLSVQDYMIELEDRIEQLGDIIEQHEDAYEDVRDEHIQALDAKFSDFLINRLASIQQKIDCFEDIGNKVGDESTGEAVTILAPYEASAEADIIDLESDIQEKTRLMLSKVGRISHDDSEANNFGRASLRGTNDPAGPSNISDADPDEMGEKIFGFVDDLQELIEEWFLPDDEITNPTPLDCSSGLPDTSDMSSLIFGMGGMDIIFGTIGNDLLGGGSGTVNLMMGLSGSDVIRGADGIDIMLGMGGDDYMHGGDGIDVMFGDSVDMLQLFPNNVSGSDCIEGEDGIDFIFGEGGDLDTLDGGFHYDLIVGGAGEDHMYGDAHIDLMIGWSGDDILLGDAEDNQFWSNVMLGDIFTMQNGAGKDEIYGTLGCKVSATIVNCNIDWIFGDIMIGGEENDTLEGADGIDIQFGGGGEDTINGRGQIDIQFGGDDIDTMHGHFGETAIEVTIMGVCVPIRLGNIMFGGDGIDKMHGGADMDVMFGNKGDDKMYGNDGGFHLLSLENLPLFGDWIFAGKGEDWVNGMWGADKIFGGSEKDTLLGDDGSIFAALPLNPIDDIIFGNTGEDKIYGGRASDFLFGNSDDDEIYAGRGLYDYSFGNDGDDEIYGEQGMDLVFGNRGNDKIYGGRGFTDLLFGNRGDDKIWGQRGLDFAFGGDGVDEIWGGTGPDVLFGNDKNDTIYGGTGWDLIFGNRGDDWGFGGDGFDLMFGNRGNDCFEGNNGNDMIFGNDGNDQLDGQDGKDKIWGDNSSIGGILGAVFNSNPGVDDIKGGPRHDRLRGGPLNDKIYGEEGNDKIRGEVLINITSPGDDLLFGGTGNDKIRGQGGKDEIYGGVGRDKLNGGDDDDLIYGGQEKDRIKGKKGDDELYGGEGDDKIRGNNQNDIAFGGPGKDRIYGNAGDDQLVGEGGNDKVKGGLGDDDLFGGFGSDRVIGGWGSDNVLGEEGDDHKINGAIWARLKGGAGSDQIDGGIGMDHLRGGTGKDFLDAGNDDGDNRKDRIFGGWGKDELWVDKINNEDKFRRNKEYQGPAGTNNLSWPSPPNQRAGAKFVYGCKWADTNGNGVWDDGEQPVVGWKIFADLNRNKRHDPNEDWTLTTADDPRTPWVNEAGCYCLMVRVPGSFTVQEELDPDLYDPSYPNNTGTWQDPNGAPFYMNEGEIMTNMNFGNVPVCAEGEILISGKKWYDWNGDGVCDPEESKYNDRIEGTLIWADLDNNGQLSAGEPSATVGADGKYEFCVPANIDRLYIREAPSSGTFATNNGLTYIPTFPPLIPHTAIGRPYHLLMNATSGVTCNFGNVGRVCVSGKKWYDKNVNGIFETGEETNNPIIEGILIWADLNNDGFYTAGEPFANVGPDGTYEFCVSIHLINGSLIIREDPMSGDLGWLLEPTFPVDSSGTPQPFHVISHLTPNITADFGNYRFVKGPDVPGPVAGHDPNAIRGFVWEDTDADGDFLPSYSVQGEGDDGAGDSLMRNGRVILDSNGNGLFDRGELSSPVSNGKSNQPLGTFSIKLPKGMSLSPERSYNLIFVSDAKESYGRTNLNYRGDIASDEDGRSLIVRLGVGPDTDLDGLADVYERKIGTDPDKTDSDGDGLSDVVELYTHRSSPTEADVDGDGLNDSEELELGTLFYCDDTDGDGVNDGIEKNSVHLDPLNPDTNNDGIWDGISWKIGSRGKVTDRDRDGASDFLEYYVLGSNPDVPDTDGDGFSDFLEGVCGFSARDSLDNPDIGLGIGLPARFSQFSLKRGSKALELDVLLEKGKQYSLQSSQDLIEWKELMNFEAVKRINVLDVLANESRGYFRLRELSFDE